MTLFVTNAKGQEKKKPKAFINNKDTVVKRLQIHLLSKLCVGGYVKGDKPEIDVNYK